MELALLVLAGSGTALATGLGVIPVWLLGTRAEHLRPALFGVTAGLMTAASVAGLVLPALDEGSPAAVLSGLALGVAFLLVSRRALGHRDVHVAGLYGAGVRRSLLVTGVLFVHSLPEGMAIGTAFASDTGDLGLFVILAIALQNIPEGTSVAIPMEDAGFRRYQQFWAAVLTSAPQPFGAVAAFLLVDAVSVLLPVSFGFAAGAMLALVAFDIGPEALRGEGRRLGAAGALAGALSMVALAAALGV